MMESDILRYCVDGGVGLVALVIIFILWRQYVKEREKMWAEYTEKKDREWQEHCQILMEMLQGRKELIKDDQRTREANTAVLAELCTLLKGLNGKVAAILKQQM